MRRVLAVGDTRGKDRSTRILAIRTWVLAFGAALAIAIGATLGMPANAATSPAEGFVQQNVDKGFAILNNHSLSASARREQFRAFLLQLTDLRRIAMFALGTAGRTASDAEKNSYYAAFEDFAVAVYDVHLSKYRGQTLKVTGSQVRAADDVVVTTQIQDPGHSGGEPIKVEFRVRKNDGGNLVVTDMSVEGVWLAISERDDFKGYLAQHGNSVAQLTAYLKQRAAKISTTGHMPSDND